jgi:hypothetical protein
MSAQFGDVTIYLGLCAFILAVFAILRAFDARAESEESRLMQFLTVQTCPSCSVVFGDSIRSTLCNKAYHWTPVRGTRLDPERCPSRTWVVICPHCAVESEYTQRGVLFVLPLAMRSQS